MKHILYLLAFILLTACDQTSSKKEGLDDEALLFNQSNPIKRANTEITYITAEKNNFTSKVFLQGNIKARTKTLISSEISGVIKDLNIIDGQEITHGSLMIGLDDQELTYQLTQNLLDLDDAVFKKRERLVMDGGEADDDQSVPPEKLKIIHTVSGYDKAQQAIVYTEFLLRRMRLTAPISGIVAGVKVNQYELISPGQEICTIIDPSSYEARFLAIEDLALQMKKGQSISIHPINDPSKVVKAKVDVINPVVNDNGLVEIRAKLSTHRYRFFENMNIIVVLEKSIPDVIVVPKEALVKRSGKDVVFIYDEQEQRAKWKYVTIAEENDTEIAISKGIENGDRVIIKGNLNLDHDASVSVADSLESE